MTVRTTMIDTAKRGGNATRVGKRAVRKNLA
jgi:hypothetical protein